MKVIFISECSKKALRHTRRILDQFAPRKGRRIWITDLTQEGLDTVQALLRRKARRNTAVICYSFFGRSLKIQFTVGKAGVFDEEGNVATDTSGRAVVQRYQDERVSALADVISTMARLAGLFHDFGKASPFFQDKLRTPENSRDEIRHEYLSALFLSELGRDCDAQTFIERLGDLSARRRPLQFSFTRTPAVPGHVLLEGKKLHIAAGSALCRMLVMLCLTHHRLPEFMQDQGAGTSDNVKHKVFAGLDAHLERQGLSPEWNYCLSWDKDRGMFRAPAHDVIIAEYSLYHSSAFTEVLQKTLTALRPHLGQVQQLLEAHETLIFHQARLCLMLSDHVYSARRGRLKFHDPAHQAWANTRDRRRVNQYLDSHVCHVSKYAAALGAASCGLRRTLMPLQADAALTADSADPRFVWQNRACDAARTIAAQARQRGFFGVNIASTGAGKTTANARLIRALSAEDECRFTYAIPLRTLTLETGRALQQRLQVDDTEVAIRIGSSTLQTLSDFLTGQDNLPETRQDDAAGIQDGEAAQETQGSTEMMVEGSELSAELDPDCACSTLRMPEDGTRGPDAALIRKLLQTKFGASYTVFIAPALVCTADYIVGASEGTRGGRQILGLLRLLSGDLILDEPDELDLCSQSALCRLAYFAGLCGSRLIISSASLQAPLVQNLFRHYRQGRTEYNQACGIDQSERTCAGICSEFLSHMQDNVDEQSFAQLYAATVTEHVSRLTQSGRTWQRGTFMDIGQAGPTVQDGAQRRAQACTAMSTALHAALLQLSARHYTRLSDNGPRVTTALIRIANIRTLVPVAQALLAMNFPSNLCLHCCIYHAQFTIVQRALIEYELEQLLGRSAGQLAERQAVRTALQEHPWARHHVFLVIASPVIEIGRDLDFDCAIIEPSSWRSLVQAAGRVQRHRRRHAESPNIAVLTQNFNALCGRDRPYSRPGYETSALVLGDHRLDHGLDSALLDPVHAGGLLIPEPQAVPAQSADGCAAGLNLLTLERQACAQFMSGAGLSFLQTRYIHSLALAQRYYPFRGDDGRPQLTGLVTDMGGNVMVQEHEHGCHQPQTFAIGTQRIPDCGRQVQFFANLPLNQALERTAALSSTKNLYRSSALAEVCLSTRPADRETGLLHWHYSHLFGFYRD